MIAAPRIVAIEVNLILFMKHIICTHSGDYKATVVQIAIILNARARGTSRFKCHFSLPTNDLKRISVMG